MRGPRRSVFAAGRSAGSLAFASPHAETLVHYCRTSAVRRSGSRFIPGKHEPGTEVKAITYSAMKIQEREDSSRVDIYVIVDI